MSNISAWIGLYLHHHGRRWLLMSVASSLLLLSFNARSQVISAKESSKTSPEVIEKARSDIAQDLFVEIEVKEIEQRQRQKREAQGLKHNDRKIVDEASQEMAAIKSKVLPGGKLEDAQVIEDFSYLPHLIVRVHSLKGLARLLQHPQVKSVQEERPFRPALSESLPLIGQPSAAAAGKTGNGYRIAVLDSGININNIAFVSSGSTGSTGCQITTDPAYVYTTGPGPLVGSSGCRLSNVLDFNYINPLATPYPYWNPVDNTGHGTNVAGIIAGVAPGAKIDSLRVFKIVDGLAHWAEVSRALTWVLANFDKSPGPIVAVNMSFAIGNYTVECSQSPYSSVFSQLRQAGILPVVASGNNGYTNGVGEPACASGAVRVGAVWDKAYPALGGCELKPITADQVACTSNSGNLLTLLAPGHFIDAAGRGFGGTSQAAPHIAGAVAVLKQANPNDSIDTILTRMTSSGKIVTDLKNNLTRPRLNLTAALTTVNVGTGSPQETAAQARVATIVTSVIVPMLLGP